MNRNFSEFTLDMSETGSDALLIKNEDYFKSKVMVIAYFPYFLCYSTFIFIQLCQTKGSATWATSATVFIDSEITKASAVAVAGKASGGTKQSMMSTEMRFQNTFYGVNYVDAFSSFSFTDVLMMTR